MTRRAFLSSKSNTAARGIEFQHACQKVRKIDDKNEDCSKTVSSFDFWNNFPPSIRLRPIQECRSHVHLCVLEKSVLEDVSGHDAGK